MIPTVFAIGAGLGLVILLWALNRRTPPHCSPLDDPGAHLLPPSDVLAAVFSRRDREFVARRRSPELLAMLETQRKAIALAWLAAVRAEAMAAIRDYRSAVRASSSVNMAQEFRIARQIAAFLCMHFLLAALVRAAGVFRVQGLVRHIDGLSLPLLQYTSAQVRLSH